MEYEHLDYFITIADEGSISRAAARLFMAQPSLSQYVRRLEGILGAELFKREARGVSLTSAGKVFYAYAQNVLRLGAAMRGEIAALTTDLAGEILVAASVLSVPIAKLYCNFKNLHPRIDVRFVRPESTVKPDMIITTNHLNAEDWDAERLLEEQLFVAVSTEHPLARRHSVRLQELVNERFIYSYNRENDKLVTQYCKEAGFEPNVLMECYSMHSVSALVEEGLGITILPAHRRAYVTDRIALLPVSDFPFSRTIYLFRPTNCPKNPIADSFAAYILENIRQAAAGYAEK